MLSVPGVSGISTDFGRYSLVRRKQEHIAGLTNEQKSACATAK